MKNHGLSCQLRIEDKIKPIFQTSESNVIIKDEKGKTVHSQPFRSFTANYLRMLWGNALSKNVTTQGKDITGADFAADAKFFYIKNDAGIYNSGLCVGTGTANVTQEDYTLSFVPDLTYYATSTGTKTSTSNSVKLPINRTIKNDTGTTKTINELGIVVDGVLIAREKLTTPVTLSAGTSRDITINLVYGFDSTTGGFVENWCDLFNSALATQILANPSIIYSARITDSCIVFNNKIWVIGGYNQPSIYNTSSLEQSWELINNSLPSPFFSWSPVIHNSKIYLLGSFPVSNTIRYTTDGIIINIITTSGPKWSERETPGVASWNGKLWVAGGYYTTGLKDVWSSSDNGVTWTEENSNAFPLITTKGKLIVFNNKLYFIASNHIYESLDGASWSLKTTLTEGAFDDFSVCVFDGKVYITGDRTTRNILLVTQDMQNFTKHIIINQFTSGTLLEFENNLYYIAGRKTTISDVYNAVLLVVIKYKISTSQRGIEVGLSSNIFSTSQTDLITKIKNGIGTNELIYGASDNLTNSEPEIVSNKCSMSLTKTFTNNSGAAIAVAEIGIKSSGLWCRIIPTDSIGIKDGENKTISLEFISEV